MRLGESTGLKEHAAGISSWASSGMKTKLEQVGYPDCIYYEQNDMST